MKNELIATIMDVKYSGIGPAEGNIILRFNKLKTLECFLDDEEVLKIRYGNFKIGNEVVVTLGLMSGGDVITEHTVKKKIINATLFDNDPLAPLVPYHYRISGRILEIRESLNKDFVFVIIDCGVTIRTAIKKEFNIKISQYITIKGRLDAHIIGKVKTKAKEAN